MGAPYIYDISSLRVNDLTFILLTWRKWLAPINVSRQQMGFNSGFKGLMLKKNDTKVALSNKKMKAESSQNLCRRALNPWD